MLVAAFLLFHSLIVSQSDDPMTDRTPAPVMSYLGAEWLERATRQATEKPELVIEAMDLEPGDVVADIGVGTGFFARRLARAVAPGGVVYGVDIQPQMLGYLEELAADAGIDNIEPVLNTETSVELPDASIDWMLLVDVYHEFQQPMPMLASMRQALKPDGRIALVEYRLLGPTAQHIKRDHRMSVEQVTAEWEPAGFELVDVIEALPSQHLFIFEKAAGEEEKEKEKVEEEEREGEGERD